MRIAITGGAGFLGARLARALLGADELSLAGAPLRDVDAVVHLAAAVSAEAEADLDVGMVNNLDASSAPTSRSADPAATSRR